LLFPAEKSSVTTILLFNKKRNVVFFAERMNAYDKKNNCSLFNTLIGTYRMFMGPKKGTEFPRPGKTLAGT
jgi:hypothetical protein